jgi:predicted helicase
VKTENFTKSFRSRLIDTYVNSPSPEEVFGYIYAILNSPCYRIKYHDLLDVDFPKIPFTKEEVVFKSISKLGWEIIQAHLLKDIPAKKDHPFGDFKGIGENRVEQRVFFENYNEKGKGKLYINSTQYFDDIPTSAYRFYIGGYQVFDRYLKDRNGKKLNLSEVENIEVLSEYFVLLKEKWKRLII